MKKTLAILFFPFVIFSCTSLEEGKEQKGEMIDSTYYNYLISELTEEQQSAFDALNELQTSTDEMNQLYSTFANLDHSFYPADTSFKISQAEMLTFMEQFIAKHCQNLSQEVQNQLAKSSVLAQKKYTVLHCSGNANYEKGLPMTGIWVLPNVLGRRDVILIW